MARSKPTLEEVELAKIRASARKTDKICETIFRCAMLAAATGCLAIIASAAVRITDRPAWVTVFLAILGLGSPPSIVAWRVIVRLKKKVAANLPEAPPAGTAALDVPDSDEEGTE